MIKIGLRISGRLRQLRGVCECRGRPLLVGSATRENDAELGSLAGRAGDLNLAVMTVNDAVRHGQSETAAIPHRLRGVEGIEGAIERRLVHAAAGIGNRKA